MRGLQNKACLSFLLPSWLVFQLLSFLEHQNSLCLPHSFPAIPSYLMQREEKGLGSEGREKVDQYEWVQGVRGSVIVNIVWHTEKSEVKT